jgi:gliding motility-associated-like protein
MRFFVHVALLLALIIPTGHLKAQVTANFTANPTSGCANLVSFFNSSSSSGNITAWSWQVFNQSGTLVNTSVLANPVFIFSPGVYTICLTVTGPSGSNQLCRTNFISSFSSPTAAIGTPITTGCSPLTVQFNDASVQGGCPITSWAWDFGDGSPISNQQNPSHTYTAAGSANYTVTLQITDACGCSNFVTINNLVNIVPPPTAGFTASGTVSCSIPFTVNFTNTSSPGNLSYAWDFGDPASGASNTSTLANPSHTYTSAGTFTPSLTVTDNISGCSDVFTLGSQISLGSASPSFGVSSNVTCAGGTIAFVNQTTGGTITNIQWDFGDGSAPVTTNDPSYTYLNPGIYTATLSLEIDGCPGQFQQTITVNPRPTALPTVSAITSCALPFTVNFTANATNTATYAWDFGDPASGANNTSTLANPSHLYSTPGPFTATLSMTSSTGCTATSSIGVFQQGPTATMNAGPLLGCAPRPLTLTDASTGPNAIASWSWQITGPNAFSQTYNVQAPPLTNLVDTGCYNIVLTVTDVIGCIDTVSQEVCAGMQLVPDFVGVPQNVCAEDPVDFTSLTPGNVTEFFWEFGDGGTSLEANPSYQYSDLDTFDVCLTAFNYGCDSTTCVEDYIIVLGPVAEFSTWRSCHPDSLFFVTFIDESVDATRWRWDFGTGNPLDTSALQNPIFDYTPYGTGNYEIVLTAYNDSTNCEYTVSRFISIRSPQANFQVVQDTGCIPFTLQIINTSVDAVSYTWTAPGSVLTNGTAALPNIRYNFAGYYTPITLVVVDTNGCADTAVFNDSIVVGRISSNFAANVNAGCAPLPVNFTDLSTFAIFPITSWAWTFGDGQTSSVQNPSIIYTAQNQSFNVRLVVTNSFGCTSTRNRNAFVQATFPVPGFTVQQPVCAGSLVGFSNTSTGSGTLTYHWDFGTGNPADTTNQIDPTFTYNTDGVYQVCLTVTDANGCDSTLCQSVTIQTPVAAFSANNTFTPCPPLTVQFTNLSTNAGPFSNAFTWDFGNGASSNQQSPSITYTQPGVYDVSLIVRGVNCRDTLTIDSFITVGGPIGSYAFTPPAGCSPQQVDVTITHVNTDSIFFVSGDGGFQAVQTATPTGTTVLNYTYLTAGSYFPSILVQDSVCILSATGAGTVNIDSLLVNFSALDSTLCINDCTSFSSQVSSNIPAAGITYAWTFNGAATTTSTNPNPSNICYPGPEGLYDVSLIVTAGACVDTLTASNMMSVQAAPVSVPQSNINQGCVPLTVNFSNSSSALSPIAFSWDFDNDGAIDATTANGSFTYNTPGTYQATLISTVPNGCSDTASVTITVFALPAADAGPNVSICLNNSTTLSATGGGLGGAYAWSPGAGLSAVNIANPVATPLSSTLYTVTVTDANTCTATDTVRVIVNSLPTVTVFSDTTICLNDTAFLTAVSSGGSGTGYTYAWTGGATTQTAAFSPALPSASFTVTLTDANGCTATDAATVTVNPLPTIAFSPANDSICPLSSTTLTASIGGVGTFVWSTGATNPSITVSPTAIGQNTFYTVTATNANGCQQVDSVAVFVRVPPTVNAGNDAVVCLNGQTQLQATSLTAISYNWSPAASLNLANIANPLATPTNTTTYTVTVTDAFGCTASDAILVTVNPLPTVTIFSDTTICLNDNANLTAVPSGGAGTGYTYLWSTTAVTASISVATALPGATYNVTLTDGNGCTATDAATVTVNPLPVLTVTPINDTICVNTTTIFTASIGGGGSFIWSTGSGNASITVAPSTPGSSTNYSVTATNANGCTATQTVSVFVLVPPAITLADSFTICLNDAVQLQATAPTAVSYSWSPGNGLSSTIISNPIASPTTSTTYTLTVTDAFGCTASESVFVNILPVPLPVAGINPANATICLGEFVQLIGTGGASIFNYNWDPNTPGLTCYQNCINPVAQPLVTTTYCVSVSNSVGCIDTACATVTVVDLTIPLLPQDTTICAGDSLTLSLPNNPGITAVSWTGEFRSCTNCNTVVVFPPDTAQYFVSARLNGCLINDSIIVNVLDPGDISAGPDVFICFGDSIQLAGIGFDSILWTPDTLFSNPYILNPFVQPDSTTNYVLTILSGACALSDTVLVEVFQQAQIEAADIQICPGDTAFLEASGYADAFSWSPAAEVSNPNIADPFATPSLTTVYTVTGSLGNCPQDVETVTVTVLEPVVLPEFNVIRFFTGENVQLGVALDTPSNFSYQWAPNTNISCTDCPNPVAGPTENITYLVTVTDADGCTSTTTIDLLLTTTCEEQVVVVPNAFTPNGDGNNDVLRPLSTIVGDIERFEVFDRWGKQVFFSSNLSTGWDGTFNGQQLNGGVYVYFLEFPCPIDGSTVVVKGNVTLIR